jgi:hypothetical protein
MELKKESAGKRWIVRLLNLLGVAVDGRKLTEELSSDDIARNCPTRRGDNAGYSEDDEI